MPSSALVSPKTRRSPTVAPSYGYAKYAADVSPMINIISPSSTGTVGPFVLAMSSSSIDHPSTDDHRQDDPSSGPRLSLPVITLPSRSAHASLARPPIASGYAVSN